MGKTGARPGASVRWVWPTLAIGWGLVAGCRGADRAPGGLRGVTLGAPFAKPEFTLTDTDGWPFDFRKETDGFTTLVFFGYTNCPDVCPLQMATLGAVLPTLPPNVAERVKVVFITTDPRRDTPQRLRSWLDHFDHDFIGLTGDSAAIAEAEQAMQLAPSVIERPVAGDTGYTVGHSALVVVFTADDKCHLMYPSGTRQADWAHDLPRLVEARWSSP
jgi:protein SCO1/2